MSCIRYGYASAPDPDSLQAQVEVLEDAKIPIDNQFAEIVTPAHSDRPQLEVLLGCAKVGDVIAVANLSALGNDFLDAYKRAKVIEERDLILEILTPSPWGSQNEMMDAFRYFGDLFQTQRDMIPAAGKPLKPYPLGWRDGFRKYMDGENYGTEICSELGIPYYDFYRMVDRYKNTLRKRKSKKKKPHS